MKSLPEHATTLAFAGIIVSLWVWHPPVLGPLLSVPLLACVPWMLRRRVRAFVLGGAFVLPYMCYAMIEIFVAPARPAAAIALLAASVIFMALLTPATRRMGRAHTPQ